MRYTHQKAMDGKKLLYVTDDKADIKGLVGYIKTWKPENGWNIYICPITVNRKLIDSAKTELSRHANIEVLPFVKAFHKNAFLYKDKFIQFLSDFSIGDTEGTLPLRRYLLHPSGKFSLWWFLSIAEKSALKKESYYDLIRLITVTDFRDEYLVDAIYVDINNNTLKKSILANSGNAKIYMRQIPKSNIISSSLTAFIKTGGYTAFFIARKIILGLISGIGHAQRTKRLKKSSFLFVTYFPFADKKLLEKNIFKNNYFGPLQTSIETRYGNKISWIAILQNNNRLNLKSLKLKARLNRWGYNIYLPEELVSFWQLGGAVLVFFYTCLKGLVKMPYLSRKFVFDGKKKLNIWNIFMREWVYSFFGSYLIGNLIYYSAFKNAISDFGHNTAENKKHIIYLFELYAWEHALNIAAHETRDAVCTVGIQHASIPLLFLNYFNTERDFRDKDSINQIPLPGHIGVSGNIPRRFLVKGGVPEEIIFDIGAIRHHGISRFLKNETGWNEREKQVVVALSNSKEESKEVLLLIWRAFYERAINYKFIIKPHPICPIDDIAKPLGFESAKNRFIINKETSLEDLFAHSRAAIIPGSSASINALACQCPVIIPRVSSRGDINPLSNVCEDLATYVTDEGELVIAVESLMASEKSPLGRQKTKAFINDYLTIVDDEEEHFRRLENELLKR